MPSLNIGSQYNRLSYRVAEELIWRYIGAPINQWRIKNGMKPLTASAIFNLKHRSAKPVIYSFSSSIFARPAEWGEHVSMPGYFFLARNRDWQPAPKLARFLETGPAPVYVGFGSMNDYINHRITELVLQALKQTGERVLLSVGWENIQQEDLSANIFITGYAPHHWLFPKMKAIIHHGGAGTTAAVLQAGVPAVIIPIMLDQPFWGNQAYKLGVCPKPIPYRNLNAANLQKALQEALYDERIRKKAAEIGGILQNEDGVANAVKEINRLVAEWEKV